MEHDLKTLPQYFEPLASGPKTFEIRRNDRDFRVGDVLLLREWDPTTATHTGRTCRRRVTYVLADFGLLAGYVCMGLAEAQANGILEAGNGD